MHNGKITNLIIFYLFGIFQVAGQTIGNIDPTPKPPQPTIFKPVQIVNGFMQNNISPNYGTNQVRTTNIFDPNLTIQQRNQLLIQQVDRHIQQNRIHNRKLIQEALSEFEKPKYETSYNLPSKKHFAGTKYYRDAFQKINEMNANDYSVKEVTFLIENAYHEGKENSEHFNQIVKQTGKFLLQKMDEFGYDKNSNVAKNFILFRFFSDTLQVKKKDLKHLPIAYDFNDYMGKNDWANMFVTKLLFSNKGQCNSMQRLYLILAEEIGAEAYLSLSPNHSYIRFKDETEHWYNVELTNQMFTTNSMILGSGYIKAEALQSKIYMANLDKKQLLSLMLVDMANGYIHKFGYDEFVKKIIDKALVLYPNGINANMLNSNFLTYKFEYFCHKFGINPRNHQELQKIKYYPKLVGMLNQVNAQYRKIDNLGYEPMPEDAYKKWLNSLQKAKQEQESKSIENRFKLKLNTFKN